MICYTTSLEGIDDEALNDNFFAGWRAKPSPRTHLELLKRSYRVVLAVDDETGKVVGFITAISDGVLSAHIPLLEVLPSHQGQGIGRELVKRMLEELRHLYMIDLLCDATLQPFYEKLGMQRVPGMCLRNYDRSCGA